MRGEVHTIGVTVPDDDGVGVALTVNDDVAEGVTVIDDDGVCAPLTVVDGVTDGVTVPDDDGVCAALTVVDGVTDGVLEGVLEGVAVVVGVTLGEGEIQLTSVTRPAAPETPGGAPVVFVALLKETGKAAFT